MYIKQILCFFLIFCLVSMKEASAIDLGCSPWPPYVTGHKEHKAPLQMIVKEAFARVHEPVNFMMRPWSRILDGARKGKIVVYCAWYNEERSREFTYSAPILVSKVSLLKLRVNDVDWQTFADLKKYRFSVERGATYSDEFDQAKNMMIYQVADQTQQIKMVLTNRVDIAPIDEASARHQIAGSFKKHAELLDFVRKPLSTRTVHLIVTKSRPDHQDIVDMFNKGLQDLIRDGTYDNILKDFNIHALRYPYPAGGIN